MLHILLLLFGFALLVKGADYFVDGASNIAYLLKISPLIVGLTIVAFGTSAPELAVSLTAALNGSNDIAIGNVVGSNIVNLLLVIGLSSLLKPLTVTKEMIFKDYPYTIVASLALLILSYDYLSGKTNELMLSRGDGLILLLFFIIYMYSLIKGVLTNIPEENPNAKEKDIKVSKCILITILGLIAIIWGGNLVVNNATAIATSLGISETLIGLTIVAIGTSLPELVTSVVAAKRGESDIALGNVVGSNIMNILLILGTSSSIHPITINIFSIYDMIILLLVSILFFIPILISKRVSKLTGITMVVTYIIYTAYILIR